MAEVKGTNLPAWLEDAYFDVIRSKPMRAWFPNASDLATSASLGWNETEGKSIPGMMAGAALETFGIPGIGYFGSKMAERPVARVTEEFLPIERMVRTPETFNFYHGTTNMDDLVNLGPRRSSGGRNVYTDGFYGTGINFMSNRYAGLNPGGGVGMMSGTMNRPLDFNKMFATEDLINQLKGIQNKNPNAKSVIKDLQSLDKNMKIDGDMFLTYLKTAEDKTSGGLFTGVEGATKLLDDLGYDGVIVGRDNLDNIQIFLHPEKQVKPGWRGKFQPGKVQY